MSSQDRDDPEQIEKERQEAARKRGWFEPARPGAGVLPALALEPRMVHVQATSARRPGQPGGDVGRISWEEHVEVCRRAGRDPERVAAAGGWGYAEVAWLLGREPGSWVAW